MLPKEYRIPMPLTVEEYKIGQLYMIAKHSAENTKGKEGIEVIRNEPCETPEHGPGQFTEKRVHVGSSLPSWIRALIPRFFYVTEKAWNHYPFTITEYSCSFLPRLKIRVLTRYENNKGDNDNAMTADASPEAAKRDVDVIDIAKDQVPDKHKHDCPDLKTWKSEKTGRGPLTEGWMDAAKPMMCSYKLVEASFEVWGLQGKVENYMHKVVRDVLLVGHVQAVAWLDEWFGMSIEDIREYEKKMQEKANAQLKSEGAGEEEKEEEKKDEPSS